MIQTLLENCSTIPSYLAADRLFAEAGARVVAIQDETGSIYNPRGLDVAAVKAYRGAHRTLAGAPGAESMMGRRPQQRPAAAHRRLRPVLRAHPHRPQAARPVSLIH